MGRYTFRLPDIGEGIAEAEIVAWHVKVGDAVEEDARIADMMTDKATVEMESPVSGTVVEVAGDTGDVIAIGSPLVVIEVEGEGNEAEQPRARKEETAKEETLEERVDEETPDAGDVDEVIAAAGQTEPAPAPAPAPAPPAPPKQRSQETARPAAPAGDAKVLASPAVRKRARDLGIDLGEVRPAEDGRIRHADLDAFISYSAAGGFQPAGTKGRDEDVRVIGLRRRIAENMAAAKRNIPHFAYVEEFDVTALEEARAQLNEDRGERPKLTLLPFLVTAICRLIPKYPMLNARYDDEAGIVSRSGAVHMGMATQTPAGLMVPVIRDAQDRNLWQLANEIARLAEAARDGTARSEELSGSTITITSLGPMGGVATTPVINRPEVAIIGPNRIVERPMFVPDGMGGERVEKRKLMNISMSCDHRVVDGYDAASFAQDLRKLVEKPALLLAG
ncbi:lipoamide acyltransferase component of branched-chain alpha-keto acid dehydrogenase complex [Novosphingobium marinum]|uniref:Dihydrolipoamide acetyltransferase component of pyruvate dehydrogenase complex n=1 Tax=Novosphingobium marinum TaxID=1514948 RepID=A0A7Z0BUS3_9SPHN|nr:dihydrolipoamide acetyltransferase family protein [Novosphingobium marinum]NYH94477.1 2-oxoisovalerate dehydrogenase E2 component (dihydrolipoyl transacylase) [Novosphingobium marinum]GGC22604.1 lipoamide acyltransferase component of branched-chain alpha-keto acid dehydrogenase complex [Novosphingobium marinum]